MCCTYLKSMHGEDYLQNKAHKDHCIFKYDLELFKQFKNKKQTQRQLFRMPFMSSTFQ